MNVLNRGKFTTGEFAKLCGTTKETLFHYDKMGLLKPQIIGENRYRYYSAKQFYQYDLIDILKLAGCSLAEIRDYMSGYDAGRYLELLERCNERLDQQKRDIERRQKLLNCFRSGVEDALNTKHDKPYLSYCDHEYMITTPVNTNDELSHVYSLNEHFTYFSDFQLGDALDTGSIIMKKEILQENYEDWCYFSTIDRPVTSDRMHIKPAGTYAQVLHRGSYDSLDFSCRQLMAWIDAQGYELVGDGYFYDLISYLATQREDDYVIKLAFQVAPKAIPADLK